MATNDVLDRLEALLAAATPGPWTCNLNGEGKGVHVYSESGPKSYSWLGTCPSNMVISTGVPANIEAAAICALRNAAPALIRLARLAIKIHPDHLCHVGTRDRAHAMKALGEVRL